MDLDPKPVTDAQAAPADMSLDDFVVFARGLQSESCAACGAAEVVSGGDRCAECAAPSLTDRLGVVGRVWRSVAYRLGIA